MYKNSSKFFSRSSGYNEPPYTLECDIHVGIKLEGHVNKVVSDGVYINFGGAYGFLSINNIRNEHFSDLSIQHKSQLLREFFELGKIVKYQIIGMKKDINGKVRLELALNINIDTSIVKKLKLSLSPVKDIFVDGVSVVED